MNTKIKRVTRAEFAWQKKQPVVESPSLARLRSALKEGGFSRIRFKLAPGHEFLQFTLRPEPEREGLRGDLLLKLLIRIFRSAGFVVGFEELAVDSGDALLKGYMLTGPLDEVAENGAAKIRRV